MEETYTDTLEPAKMPQFLKVLCILSFIGIGVILILSIVNYFTYSAMASYDASGGSDGSQFGEAMNSMVATFGLDYGKMATSALVTGIINIPLLLGVLLMWKRKKIGFFIYALLEIGQALVPLIIIGGFTGISSAILWGIIAIAFIIMYGVNLKHMS